MVLRIVSCVLSITDCFIFGVVLVAPVSMCSYAIELIRCSDHVGTIAVSSDLMGGNGYGYTSTSCRFTSRYG